MKGIFANVVDPEAISQIYALADNPAIDTESIAMMPDIHPGAGVPIGFTGRFKDNLVIPNVVGVDIGCGVITYQLGKVDIDLEALDEFIRKTIPTDYFPRTSPIDSAFFIKNKNEILTIIGNATKFLKAHKLKGAPITQLGSLGGGNHFIEVEKDEFENLYLTIHSGSRNFGKQVADFYQKCAIEFCEFNGIKIPKSQAFLPGEDYLRDMNLAQRYATWNRLIMLWDILKFLNIPYAPELLITSVHNYIEIETGIVRKGAISAKLNELSVIPLNMGKDGGILIGYGRGYEPFNFSAPHGAGRVMGRGEAKRLVDSDASIKDQIRDSMDGVYCKHTPVSEAAMVYKTLEDILPHLEMTIKIFRHAKPIYCYKGN